LAGSTRSPVAGAVEAGKRADLVVVGGRPWERIADVRDVRLVIQGGGVVVDGAR
jgi:imidazolonepropionase-like amidohydrolase